jgi:hypothetical protein
MTLTGLLIAAILITIALHFVGVYAGAKKTVWLTLVLLWAAAINIATNEISDKGYKDLERMRGKFKATDEVIKAAEPEVSFYEMVGIKQSYFEQKKLAQ